MSEISRLNCWEVLSCGRGPEEAPAGTDNACPAAHETRLDGVHGGRNGGRACWAVAGTFCGGEIMASFAGKTSCVTCDFYNAVIDFELGTSAVGSGFVFTANLRRLLAPDKRRRIEQPAQWPDADIDVAAPVDLY